MNAATVRRALRRHDGNIARAAEEVGLPYDRLRKMLKQLTLGELVKRLRAERRRRDYEKLIALLIEHRGNVAAVARALGIRQSSLTPRVTSYGLDELVRDLRPRRPTPAEEKARLLDAIRRHHGQMWRVGEELGVSKGTLLARVRKHDLFAEADALRVEANLTGPRTRLPKGRNRKERRAKLIALLDSCNWKVSRAHRLAGVSVATFYTMLRNLGIDRPTEALRQPRLHQLIDALRVSGGVLARAARVMGFRDYRTVSRWCEELEIDPRDYRN